MTYHLLNILSSNFPFLRHLLGSIFWFPDHFKIEMFFYMNFFSSIFLLYMWREIQSCSVHGRCWNKMAFYITFEIIPLVSYSMFSSKFSLAFYYYSAYVWLCAMSGTRWCGRMFRFVLHKENRRQGRIALVLKRCVYNYICRCVGWCQGKNIICFG